MLHVLKHGLDILDDLLDHPGVLLRRLAHPRHMLLVGPQQTPLVRGHRSHEPQLAVDPLVGDWSVCREGGMVMLSLHPY